MARRKFNIDVDEYDIKNLKEEKIADKFIDIDDIDPYEFNDVIYPPEQYEAYMEELVEDIRRRGLQQSVELVVNPNDNTRYISVGGNRRCAAIRKLVHEEGLEEFRMVKATITTNMTEDEIKENCIMSNSYRDKTNYTKMQEIEVLQELAKKKKERGEDIRGLRAYLSNRTGLGETQTGKYQRVINKATEEVKKALEQDILSLDTAAEVSSLPQQKQNELVNLVEEGKMTNTDVFEIAKEIKKEVKSKPSTSKPKEKMINVEKTWSKITKELYLLLNHDEEDKELIQNLIHLIEKREGER